MNVKMLLKDKNVLRVVVFIAIVNLLGYVMVKDFNAVIFFIIVGFLATYYSKNMIVVSLIAMVATNVMVVAKRRTREGFTDETAIKTAAEAIAKAAVAAKAESKTEDDAITNAKTAALEAGATGDDADTAAKAAVKAFYNGKSEAEAAEAALKALYNSKSETKAAEAAVKGLYNGKSEAKDIEPAFRTNLNTESSTETFADQSDTPYANLEKKIDHSLLTNVNEDADKLVKRQKELLEQYEKLQPALERSYKLLNSMGGADGVQGMIEKVGGMIDKFGGMSGNINKK